MESICEAYMVMQPELRKPHHGGKWLHCWSCHDAFEDGEPIALALVATHGHTNKPLCQACCAEAMACEGVES
ncbi:MAG: hypothetical protein AB7S38_28790 [Vulcanimicrobiota bacterium]